MIDNYNNTRGRWGGDALSTRAGVYIQQPTGYRAFVPTPLPPDPPLRIDAELLDLLSKADIADYLALFTDDVLPITSQTAEAPDAMRTQP